MIMYDIGLRSDTIVKESVTELSIRFLDLNRFGCRKNHQNMVVGFPLGVICRTFHGTTFDKKIKIS